MKRIKIPSMGNKGQFTIIALIMVFLTVVTFAVLRPQFQSAIDDMIPSLDSLSALLAAFLVPLVFLVIIISVLWYARPVREY